MSKGSLMLVPSGGLANRMRAVMSGYVATREAGSRLTVVWFPDWALNAPFHEIFEPIDPALFEIREARPTDYLLNDRPRRHNFRLTRYVQRLAYARIIEEQCVTPLKMEHFDFVEWMRGRRCYMSSYQDFGTFPDSLYAEIFRPVKPVRDVIDATTSQFAPRTIGMHIRRTDNADSIAQSPTSLFIEAGERELAANPDLKIFLATDSEDVKAELRAVFGDRILTPSAPASRDSIEGIRGGLAELYTLAATSRIYGSANSSYSTMAAKIGSGKTELVVCQKKD